VEGLNRAIRHTINKSLRLLTESIKDEEAPCIL